MPGGRRRRVAYAIRQRRAASRSLTIMVPALSATCRARARRASMDGGGERLEKGELTEGLSRALFEGPAEEGTELGKPIGALPLLESELVPARKGPGDFRDEVGHRDGEHIDRLPGLRDARGFPCRNIV